MGATGVASLERVPTQPRNNGLFDPRFFSSQQRLIAGIYMTVDLGERVAYERFGEMVGVTRQAVAAAVAAGVLERDGTLAEWLRAYCENLRRHAAGRAVDPDLAAQRTRLARERADQIEIRNRRSRRELAPVGRARGGAGGRGAPDRGGSRGVPAQLKRRATNLTPADLRVRRGLDHQGAQPGRERHLDHSRAPGDGRQCVGTGRG